MQPHSYIAVPNPNTRTVPVRYMVPGNYRQTLPVRPPYPYASQPMHYQPVNQARSLPPPPPETIVPIPLPNQYRQQYPQQYHQPYYYDPNVAYPPPPYNSKPSKTTVKTGYKDDKYALASNGTQNKGIQNLVGNSDINELLKHKGTKIKVSKIYRISKKKPNLLDDDTSDDEYESVPLDSPSPRLRTRTLKQSSVPIQRIPSAASSCSHCSTCTNCSCSDCRTRNSTHPYDDCRECRAERERQYIQETQQKK